MAPHRRCAVAIEILTQCVLHNVHNGFTISKLTRWGRVTHICVSKLTSIGPDNGLSPDRRQAIIWSNAGKLSIGHLGTNFSEMLIAMYTFLSKKMQLKMSSGKSRRQCVNNLRNLIGALAKCSVIHQGYVCYLPGAKIPSPSPLGQPTSSRILVRTMSSISVNTGAISYVNLRYVIGEIYDKVPLLLTLFNFNPSIGEQLHPL